MKGEITRKQLVALLESLVAKRQTTTLYVRTDDNHLIAIGVAHGEIVSLICGPRQGERAIPQIRKMRSGTYRLDDKAMPHQRAGTSLPSSKTLLSLLSADDDAPANDCDWLQDVLCNVLRDYVGPIAPVVCRDTVEAAGGVDSPEKVRRVVEELAREIDDANEAKRFVARAQAELGSVIG